MKVVKAEMKLYDDCRKVLNGASDRTILSAIFLLFRTKQALDGRKGGVDEEQIYNTMLEQADMEKVENPFSSHEDFIYIYRIFADIEKLDWECLLTMEDSKASGAMHIPSEIFNMMEEHFQPDTNQVLIAEGQKFAPFLKKMIDRHSHCQYVITVQEELYAAILKGVFKDSTNVVVEQANVYTYEFLQQKFDLILALPAFSARNLVDETIKFICREYEMVALENLSLHLSPRGRLAIIMPAKITFAGAQIRELRNFIQEMYCLEEISELPNGTFRATGIKTYLICISTGHTEDVTIKRYDFDNDKKMILRDESFVVASELVEQGDWNLDKLFARQDEEWKHFMERGSRIRLREVAQVFRGKSISRKRSTEDFAKL